MRIREFSIDRFGVLHNQRVSGLSPGITVFTGENEAGKSTCLNFFRAMLFGYARQRRSIDYLPDVKAVSGGSLLLDTDLFGPVRLARRPGPHGGPFALSTPDGAPLPDGDLAALLRGCTPEVYDKVFAFSLGELMHFGSLTDDRVRHALHGAAFGLGLRSPGQVLKILEDDMRRIFAPRASTSRIHKLLQELDAVNAAVKARGNEVDRYALLRADLEQAEADLAASRAARLALERERRDLERKAALRRRWETLREAEDALAALPEVAGAFTADGPERLDRLAERLEDRRHALHAARLALERAERETAAPDFDPGLAEAAPELFSLLERKERIRDALGGIRAFQAEKDALAGDVAAVCRDLGPGWDAAALEACDVSLAAHERCDTLGRDLGTAEQAASLGQRERERLEREHRSACLALEETRSELAAIGKDETGESEIPDGAVGDDAAERLGQLLVRAGDAHEKTGALALAARNAEQALDRAVADLDPNWSRQDLERADLPPGARERLPALARAAEAAAEAVASAGRDKTAAALLAEDIAERVDGLQRSVAALLAAMPGGADSLARAGLLLDARRDALRRIRAARAALDAAQNAYASANEQLGDIASLIRGTRRTSTFPWAALILFSAALLVVCGGGVLYLGLNGGTETMVLSGAVALAAGLALAVARMALAAGSGADSLSETMDRNWSAIEQRLVRTRINAHTARAEAEDALASLAPEHPDLFPGGVPDPELLGEAERLLARQREQLAILERETRELERENHSLAAARRRLVFAEDQAAETARARDAALAAWRDALTASRLPAKTPPQDARILLERLDAALARRAHWQGRLADQREAGEALCECLRFARSLPGMAGRLASLPEPDSHLAPDPGPWLDAVRAYLTEWRRAGRERIRLRELAAARAARRDELAGLLLAANQASEEAAATMAARTAAWQAWLAERNLPRSLSPETARQALEAAARAKSALQAMRRLDARMAAAREDTQAFARQLAPHARFLPGNPALASLTPGGSASDGLAPDGLDVDGFGADDSGRIAALLAALDDLAAAAREAGEKAAVIRAREREIPALRDAADLAARHADSAGQEMRVLLEAARCESPEEYRLAHAAWEKREAALAVRQAAFAALRREADEAGIPLEEAMTAFAAASREETELLLAEKEAGLGGAIAAEQAIAERKGGLDAAMAGLCNEQGLTILLAQRENIVAEIAALSREWARLAVARNLLLTAKSRFEAERQTGVARAAGELFKTVTNGAYSGITINLDDETVGAVNRNGAVLNPETGLSRGTREQLYLALRLAYILDHGAQAEKLPVIMDDILVNFDAVRAARTAEALATAAREHQILFFTCHAGTARLLAEAAPGTVTCGLRQGCFVAE